MKLPPKLRHENITIWVTTKLPKECFLVGGYSALLFVMTRITALSGERTGRLL